MRLGVDIGGTKTDVVLVHAGAIVARHKTPSGFGPEQVLAAANSAVEAVLSEAGATLAQVESAGIGVPGGVADGVVSHARNLGLERLDLAGILHEAWGIRPVIDNDVNVAALGAWGLNPRGAASIAYLNLGTGLAVGIILDGKLWRGVRGSAGEIGHISVDPAGPLDTDGLPGALETYASGSGIARQWGVEGAESRDVLAAAEAGDERAVAIRDGLFFGVASAVRALILTLDVDAIVLGGGLAGYGEPLMLGTREVLDSWAARSDFLASLNMGDRIELLDSDLPVAALGAAELGAVIGAAHG